MFNIYEKKIAGTVGDSELANVGLQVCIVFHRFVNDLFLYFINICHFIVCNWCI